MVLPHNCQVTWDGRILPFFFVVISIILSSAYNINFYIAIFTSLQYSINCYTSIIIIVIVGILPVDCWIKLADVHAQQSTNFGRITHKWCQEEGVTKSVGREWYTLYNRPKHEQGRLGGIQPWSKKVSYLDTLKIVIANALLTTHPNISQDLAYYKSVGIYWDARIVMAYSWRSATEIPSSKLGAPSLTFLSFYKKETPNAFLGLAFVPALRGSYVFFASLGSTTFVTCAADGI